MAEGESCLLECVGEVNGGNKCGNEIGESEAIEDKGDSEGLGKIRLGWGSGGENKCGSGIGESEAIVDKGDTEAQIGKMGLGLDSGEDIFESWRAANMPSQ